MDRGQDGPTKLSQALIEALNSTGMFEVELIGPGVDAKEYVLEQIKPFSPPPRLLVIPEGFQDDAINATMSNRVSIILSTVKLFLERAGGYINETQRASMEEGMERLERFNATLPKRPATVLLYLDPSDSSGIIVESIVRSMVTAFNYRLLNASPAIEVQKEDISVRRFRAVDYYLPGYISAFIMTNGVIGVLSVTTELRRRGIIKRFMVTPMKRSEWILANVISQSILAIILTVVMVFVAWAAFGAKALPGPFAWLFILLGAVLFTGMGMFLGGLVKDVEAASALGNLIAFPMMFLSGAFWPLEIMPTYMQYIAKALPLTYFSEGLRFAMVYGDPWLAMLDMAVVAVLAFTFIALGSVTTKWRVD